MIKVAVAGCMGRMGSTIVSAIENAEDMVLACGIDPAAVDLEDASFPIYASVSDAIDGCDVDVLVDFTRPDVVAGNVEAALCAGIDCVVGTTGLTTETLECLAACASDGAALFYAPNFTTGAVLMMQFAKIAAPFFPQAEVLEFHHCNKLDSPSGTAVQTARLMGEARDGRPSEAPGAETEVDGAKGARGALIDGIPVHSIRSAGYVASQEVVLGSYGQSLTIRHDSWDRESYMPGVILGIRSVSKLEGLVVGLENLMDI